MVGMSGLTASWNAGGTRLRICVPRSPPTPTRLSSAPVPAFENWLTACGGTPAAVSWPGQLLDAAASRRSCRSTASPTEPPIWRKKVRLLVATPSCRNGTAFWTTIVKTDSVGPMPTPVTNIQNQRVVIVGVRLELGHQGDADGHDHQARSG